MRERLKGRLGARAALCAPLCHFREVLVAHVEPIRAPRLVRILLENLRCRQRKRIASSHYSTKGGKLLPGFCSDEAVGAE